MLCIKCLRLGYCARAGFEATSDTSLTQDFLSDLHHYALALKLPRRTWPDYLMTLYARLPIPIRDKAGNEISFDPELFEGAGAEDFFRRFCCKPLSPNRKIIVRTEARPRLIAMASILRANDPAGTRMWGVRAANDN
jgi:hypothetical protein